MQVLAPHSNKYPRSFEFLKADLPRLQNARPDVWRAFLEHSKLTAEEATIALGGSRPPLIFAQKLGSFVWAQFDPEIPHRIELSAEVLQAFEGAPDSIQAQDFLRAKTLHEMCHWGCFQKKFPDPDNAGELFESQAFNGEQQPWWQVAINAIALANAELEVFKNPEVRAQRLQACLKDGSAAPGRTSDPEHVVFAGEDVAAGMPRGYRNNNPGNMRIGSAWMGLSEPHQRRDFQRDETSFCVFSEPEWGLRAMAYLLRKYKSTHKLKTPREIIARWAPTSDNNDVDSYSAHVAAAVGVQPDDTIDVNDDGVLVKVIRAMATHENGRKPPYSEAQFLTALRLLPATI